MTKTFNNEMIYCYISSGYINTLTYGDLYNYIIEHIPSNYSMTCIGFYESSSIATIDTKARNQVILRNQYNTSVMILEKDDETFIRGDFKIFFLPVN